MLCLRSTAFTFFALTATAIILIWTSPATRAADGFDQAVQPYLERHCLRCHGADKKEGEMRLDTLSRDFLGGGSAGHWGDVLERISAAEMPPEDEPQPSSEESAKVVEWIAARLKEGEAARLAKRERVTFHRLTRDEYASTIFDLLGVRYDAADPTGLPEDGEWQGFERIGSVLSLSPSHVEKYFAAAESVLAEALPDKRAEPFLVRRDAIDLRGGQPDRATLEAQGLADKVRVEMWPGHDIVGRSGPGRALPATGEYRCRVQLSGLQPAGGRAPRLVFYAVNLDRVLFEQDIVAAEDAPIIVEFTCHLPAGNHNFRMTNDVPGPSNLPRSGRSDPSRRFTTIKEGRSPWQLKLTDEAGQPLFPFLIVDWIEWQGPILAEGPTYAEQNYLPADPQDPAQLRAALRRFAERAFRRPVAEAEVERYAKLIDHEVQSGEPFLAAMKTGLLAILCSKDFIYLVEGAADRPGQQLSDWELAARLSYFLWGTMPDEALFAAARNGNLREPAVLREQVTRMLADAKSERFVSAFPRQWLQLRHVGMFPPDKKLYPDYDPYLEQSMIGETVAFFGEVLKQNLTLREFLASDWTMLNARLAEHYRLPSPGTDRYTKVALKPEDHRGGILTQAAILSLTSDGTRHRPVHRGKWVLESIFGKPPPPPPANVKPIEPAMPTEAKATLRQKLEAHQRDANCASCHRKIDPLGFAFDNYDAIGRWRTEETLQTGVGANPPIDASGELADGRQFDGPQAFKQLLCADIDRFNAAFVEKLSIFALRRTMTIDDRDELAQIAATSKASGYRLPAIVEALVLSSLFQER